MTAPDDASRRFCAETLAGGAPDPGRWISGPGLDAVIATAESEGVLVALHAALTSESASPLQAALAVRARSATARNLLGLSQVRAIQQALHAAGIPCLWLKGVALGQWLYPAPHLRELADLDLLLPDHATALRAADVLASLGYALPNRHIAGNLVVHELLAWSERAQLELDLHWRLSNDALFADRLQWGELREEAIALPALGPAAVGLAPVHAFLHACIHRALNYLTGRENRLRWLYDIHLLAARLTPDQWEQVASLAASRGMAGACHDGLVATAETFNTRLPETVMAALAAAGSKERLKCPRLRDWHYFQWATWCSLPDTRTRLRWLRQLLFPDMAHLKTRYGGEDIGPIRLLWRRLVDGWRRLRSYHQAVD